MRSAACGEADPLQQLVAARFALGLGDPVQGGLQAHVLAAGQQRVERRLLQGGADRGAHPRALADDVEAGDPRRARGRRQQRRQHQHRGRLAGAVGAEEAVDLAGGDPQVDAVDRPRPVLELAHEAFDFDAVAVRAVSLPSALFRVSGQTQYLRLANIETRIAILMSAAKSEENGAGGGRSAREAWGLLAGLVYPPPFSAIARELGLRPAAFGALRMLDQPRTMSEIAGVAAVRQLQRDRHRRRARREGPGRGAGPPRATAG